MEYYHQLSYPSTNNCCECETRITDVKCSNCDFHVCEKKKCSFKFEQYNNITKIICKTCYDEIDEKFKLVINYTDLTLLKKKIKLKRKIQEA